jgi:sarcosine oxidase
METRGTVVVGGGVIGAAIAEALALRGEPTTLVERHAPGHTKGSSHGDGRIFRFSYPEADYVRLAARAFDGWRRLERRRGESLLLRCGTWDAAESASSVLPELETAMRAFDLPCERYSARESRARWPQLAIEDGWEVLHQPGGGVLRADRAVAALWDSARAAGADLLSGHEVDVIETDSAADLGVGLRVVASGASHRLRARRVVVAGGSWNGGLLAGLGLHLPLTITRELVAYFAEESRGASPTCEFADHGAEQLPAFLFHPAADSTEPLIYGLPRLEVGGVKVGRHHAGQRLASPDEPIAAHDENLAALCDFVRDRLPLLGPKPIATARCLYTTTPDRDFVLDRLPGDPRVVVAAGFSGHGFKFAPAIGELVAALILEQEPALSLARYRCDRPTLRTPR